MQDTSYRKVIDGGALSQEEKDLGLKLTNTNMLSLQFSLLQNLEQVVEQGTKRDAHMHLFQV